MPVDPRTGEKLPYANKEEEYMAAAERNMPGDAPPDAPPEAEAPPPEAPPEEGPVATMQLSLTPNAIQELSKPENRDELMKLVEAGSVAMAEGAEAMEGAAA